MIYNLFVVPVHLHFHDVDEDYIKGIFEVMSTQYSGEVHIELRDDLKYPQQIQCGFLQRHLSDVCKKLKLNHLFELQSIENHLNHCQRCRD